VRRRGIEAAVFAVLVPSCSLLTTLGDLGGDAGPDVSLGDASDAVVADVASDQATSSDGGCPDALPAMVATPLGFCIDSTEVTRGQYADFLNSGPAVANQIAACAFNTSFIPTGNWPDTSSLPVVDVDWCDAYAFCAWAGKRLCGAVQGGTLSSSGVDDPAKDEWFAACTRGGSRLYPYGSMYDAAACNGSDRGLGAPVAVASEPGCVGGYPGVFDMSGNIWEWRDSCVVSMSDAGTAKDTCVAGGGAYTFVNGLGDASDQMQCRSFGLETRGSSDSDRGFRCCSP
jgi:sulfatase modifying factor 1